MTPRRAPGPDRVATALIGAVLAVLGILMTFSLFLAPW